VCALQKARPSEERAFHQTVGVLVYVKVETHAGTRPVVIVVVIVPITRPRPIDIDAAVMVFPLCFFLSTCWIRLSVPP
jgi:hypothetical protein